MEAQYQTGQFKAIDRRVDLIASLLREIAPHLDDATDEQNMRLDTIVGVVQHLHEEIVP